MRHTVTALSGLEKGSWAINVREQETWSYVCNGTHARQEDLRFDLQDLLLLD